jgi:hypothetical protein
MTDRITVCQLAMDSDGFGGDYVSIAIGYRLPTPRPKGTPPNAIVQAPTLWKWAIHLIIPKEQWMGQYAMFQEFDMEIKPNGDLILKEAKPQ